MNSTSVARRDFLKSLSLGATGLAQTSLLFADERVASTTATGSASSPSSAWPVLKRYDRAHQHRVAMPLGGIGTGTVSLGGRGDLRDWEIMNRPAKGFTPSSEAGPFFSLYLKTPSGQRFVRALEGPLDPTDYEGSHGSDLVNHGLPRFGDALFAAAYPLAQVLLRDSQCPIDVRLEAFNPLVPADAEISGLPIAVLRYALHNRSNEQVTAAVCGNMPNFIGIDGSEQRQDWKGDLYPIGAKANRNRHRRGTHVEGIFLDTTGVDRKSPAWGTMALATPVGQSVAYRTTWLQRGWGGGLLDFWDDFAADGSPDNRKASTDSPMASLSVLLTLPPATTRTVTFLITWHFPNRRTWTPRSPEVDEDIIGNYYTTHFSDAWDAAEKIAPQLPEAERRTVSFVRSLCECDLPQEVREAALFNVSTLRSQTCFRTPDGRFFGFEGCCNKKGCCHGSCTHVWNYEQATAFLFGSLAQTMRDVEFGHATDDQGLMSFRTALPLSRAKEFGKGAADGQMGCLMKVYRDWQLSGDTQWLKNLWPHVRRALEFCWIPGGWDADRDGVMEGCQHNTMDVEYYGPNPQMQFWYLGALRAVEAMASHLGETEFARECQRLFQQGRNWTDANLFNGEYFIHQIQLPEDASEIAPSLRIGMGAKDPTQPDFQLGAGCLVDQLVGQFMAHVCGVGYLAEPDSIRRTLDSIWQYNRRTGMSSHFNNMRSFALGDENALLMASFPKDRPQFPFPYFTEVMTGFEYTAAVGMLYEGQRDRGLECIRDIRARYDGRKRSPFNEAECGHHYARAMASWAAVLALTGFHFSAVNEELQFAAQPGHWFWSTGHAWGTCTLRRQDDSFQVHLQAAEGQVRLKTFRLTDAGIHRWAAPKTVHAGETLEFTVDQA
jgi:uncharacterized protein (DUF608 family)